MMLCAIAKLDEASTKRLTAVRNAALPADAGSSPLHGHITIAAYTGGDETQFQRVCRELLAGQAAFSVRYERLEILEETSIIVASPVKAGALDALHRKIAERFAPSLDQWTRDDSWYPHTTLLYRPGTDLRPICQSMRKAFVPFSAEVCGIEFSRVTESGYEITGRIGLV